MVLTLNLFRGRFRKIAIFWRDSETSRIICVANVCSRYFCYKVNSGSPVLCARRGGAQRRHFANSSLTCASLRPTLITRSTNTATRAAPSAAPAAPSTQLYTKAES